MRIAPGGMLIGITQLKVDVVLTLERLAVANGLTGTNDVRGSFGPITGAVETLGFTRSANRLRAEGTDFWILLSH
jgi:hypothetical protein